MDGSRLPIVTQDPQTLDLVAQYTPILMCDANEPFDLVALGYTIFGVSSHSDSFPRWVELADHGASRAIECALWWDWDIQHLYELEHLWSFLDSHGNLIAAEASFHSYYVPIGEADSLQRERAHPIVFVEAGKHAMLASPAAFDVMHEDTIKAAHAEAGRDGLLVKEMFDTELKKSPDDDGLIEAYLRARGFTPTFEFTKRVEIAREQMIPWNVMRAWIPARCKWWIEKIGGEKRGK